MWSIILNLTLSPVKREANSPFKALQKKKYLKVLGNYYTEPYTETSPYALSVGSTFLSVKIQSSLYSLPCIHQSKVWMLVLTYFNWWCRLMIKQSDICNFIFLQLSLSLWLTICNDAWLLSQRKKRLVSSALHFFLLGGVCDTYIEGDWSVSFRHLQNRPLHVSNTSKSPLKQIS